MIKLFLRLQQNLIENQKVFYIYLIGILIIAIGVRIQSDNKEQVLSDYESTTGWPINYSTVGSFQNCYIKYEYKVSGITYSRSVGAPNMCDLCDFDLTPCADKLYWVVFERKNPSNSLINLKVEIQNLKNTKKPTSTEHFK